MRFQCENCEKIVSIDDSECGQAVGCGHCGSITTVPQTRVSPKALINDFVITQTLGAGGMGTVYLAHQLSLDRPVALKILLDQFAHNSEFIVDFVREARAAARLNHPNIVQSYAVGEDDGIYFFAMEFVEGQTLKQVLNGEDKMDWERAFNIIQQIAEALDFAWKNQQLVHRDIKPDNIMLTKRGVAKLADLGLARAAHETSDDDDEVMGTPQYICPEQLLGQPMDVRGDIYSLGATLFHAITGNFPFEGNSAADIARKHLNAPIPDPREFNQSIPAGAVYVVQRMMAKRLEDRYDDAEELVVDMGLVLRGQKPAGMKAAAGDEQKKKKPTKGGKTGRLPTAKSPGKADTHSASRKTSTGTGLDAGLSPKKQAARPAPASPIPSATGDNRNMSSGKIKSTKLKSTRMTAPAQSAPQVQPQASAGYKKPGSPAPQGSGGSKAVVILLVLVIFGILGGVSWFILQMMTFGFKTSQDAKTYYLFEVATAGERDAYQEIEGYLDGKYSNADAEKVLAKTNIFLEKYNKSLFAQSKISTPQQWAVLYKVPGEMGLIAENIPKVATVWVGQILTFRKEIAVPKYTTAIRKELIDEEADQIKMNEAKFNFDREKEAVWSELESYAGEFVNGYQEQANRLTGIMQDNDALYAAEQNEIRKDVLADTTMCDFKKAMLYLSRKIHPAEQVKRYPKVIKNEASAISREIPLDKARRKLAELHRRFIEHRLGGTVKKEEIDDAFLQFIQTKGYDDAVAKIRALPGRERTLFDTRQQWLQTQIKVLTSAMNYYKLVAGSGDKFGQGWDTKRNEGIRKALNLSQIGKRLKKYGWTSNKYEGGDQVWVQNVTTKKFVVQLRRYNNQGIVMPVGTEDIPHWEAANLTIFHDFAKQVKNDCEEDFNNARMCFELLVRPTIFKALSEKGIGGESVPFGKKEVDKFISVWNPAWANTYMKHMQQGLRKMLRDDRRTLVKYIDSLMSPISSYQEMKAAFDKYGK